MHKVVFGVCHWHQASPYIKAVCWPRSWDCFQSRDLSLVRDDGDPWSFVTPQTSVTNSFVPHAVFIAHYTGSCSICHSQRLPSLGTQLSPSWCRVISQFIYFWILHRETSSGHSRDVGSLCTVWLYSLFPLPLCVCSSFSFAFKF